VIASDGIVSGARRRVR